MSTPAAAAAAPASAAPEMVRIGRAVVSVDNISFAFGDDKGLHIVLKEEMEVKEGEYGIKYTHAGDLAETTGWVERLRSLGVTIRNPGAESIWYDSIAKLIEMMDPVKGRALVQLIAQPGFMDKSIEERERLMLEVTGLQ